jgi:large subunit ribosomal protein L4
MADNESTNFQASAFTVKGAARDKVSLPETFFDGTVNMPVMHQAVKAYLANQRQGTAATKTRGYVTGGNQKPWRQKGTGRARQGSTRAPHWVGGGTVFGPQPRSYRQTVPRQVRALARKSAFNARAREDAIFVIERFDFDAPKTSRMQGLLDTLGVAERKVLMLTNGVKSNVFLSARNIPNVHVMPYGDASTYHILWSDVVVIESDALGENLETVADDEMESGTDVETAAPKKAKKSAKAGKTAKKTAAKKTAARTKTAAKKTAAKKGSARTKKSGGK